MGLSFSFSRIPTIHCGTGILDNITDWLVGRNAKFVLLVTGSSSLERHGHLGRVQQLITNSGATFEHIQSQGEPSSDFVDAVSQRLHSQDLDAVIAVGGGSAIDLGKALAAMIPVGNSVLDHLEGVGKGISHGGEMLPYLAIPTTSGTGGEVSKNAVLSQVGVDGYKKSLRHENFIPHAVILDSDLLIQTEPAITAACGMDALTQLLEPYFSDLASPITDAIVWSGLEALVPNLLAACGDGAGRHDVRLGMAYGALCSGIGLANAGLGIVHGLAGPIGGWFEIPHGVICGTLIGSAQRQNWLAIQDRAPHHPVIRRMARVGSLMPGAEAIKDEFQLVEHLTTTLEQWVDALAIPRLGIFGLKSEDLDRLVLAASNRNNPIQLSATEIRCLLERRL